LINDVVLGCAIGEDGIMSGMHEKGGEEDENGRKKARRGVGWMMMEDGESKRMTDNNASPK
jgi:hypothetical protein